jgi:hypothetical protein
MFNLRTTGQEHIIQDATPAEEAWWYTLRDWKARFAYAERIAKQILDRQEIFELMYGKRKAMKFHTDEHFMLGIIRALGVDINMECMVLELVIKTLEAKYNGDKQVVPRQGD